MDVKLTSSYRQIDTTKAKQTNCVEVFLSPLYGECKTLHPIMLNGLLVLVTESDWALSTILKVEYIKPLEEYCSKTQPCDVPVTLPKLLIVIVPSASTDSSSELVPFAGRLCFTLAEHVSEMKSLFAESSASDGTVSAPSATLPEESPLLSGNTVLEMLWAGFSLLYSLLLSENQLFDDILIYGDIVTFLKSTIVACLDLLEQQKTESICPHTGRTDKFIRVLDISWNCAGESLYSSHKSLHPIVESVFSDVPQLCSLLERTCCFSSSRSICHLKMIINLACILPRFIPGVLEENLVERMINTSTPMTVPTEHGGFHLFLIWAITNLIWDPRKITEDKEERKRIQKLEFERVLIPAKRYLQFIFQREEFIPKVSSGNQNMSTIVGLLLGKTLILERDLFEYGEIVETGREEWEVEWLVKKTNEKDLGERLQIIRAHDVRMKKKEKARWKKRVERQREAGHSDAMEGWLMRRDNETRTEIVNYLRQIQKESGMNVRF
ncbi:hypothetical protein BLNAU_10938 [Blattamonas nauphoetae]|uniref:Uncharacterized protein n=1 Tax=Blattamonas nauphoetae TaxID=2049346 RepID=A0ABQ9XPY5_9EUKA|nr:hypothetical protein BLNAU_10938 [Blattamonas nauphoetae]